MNLQLLGRVVLPQLFRLRGDVSSLDVHLRAAVKWLSVAQDARGDGGVAIRYSLVRGWEPSYPETTGYIIPTFLKFASHAEDRGCHERAIRMADWELSIQNDDGSYHGGEIGSGLGKMVFDTGQVVRGLVEAFRATGKEKYKERAVQAGDWLVANQEENGMWVRHALFAIPHTYYARVAWALAELGKAVNREAYCAAAARNIDWVLLMQRKNGWYDSCGFTQAGHSAPYTHTIAYTMRGILEVGACLGRERYIDMAVRSADSLLRGQRPDGSLAAKYDENWKPVGSHSCLTGDAQTAIILFRLYEIIGTRRYLQAAQAITRHLCAKQMLEGSEEVCGAIGGSHPAWGDYERLAFPNWAAKFFADALLKEKELDHR